MVVINTVVLGLVVCAMSQTSSFAALAVYSVLMNIGFMTIFLAPRDVGRRLGITTSGVIALVGRGQLREMRDSSGRRFFDPVDVERLAKEREAKKRRLHGTR